MQRILLLVLLISSSILSTQALASRDVKGSSDHPLISRYPGFFIKGYNQIEYDEAELITGQFDTKKKTAKTITVEGKVTNILYQNKSPAMNVSALQLYKNYEKALKKLKPKFLLACRGKKCFHKQAVDLGFYIGNWAHKRTLMYKGVHKKYGREIGILTAAINNNSGGKTHIMISVGVDTPNKKRYVLMSIVESDSLDTDKIAIGSVDDIRKGIETEGKIELEGIYFDHNKAHIKPESRDTLDIIASYLSSNPNKSFYVVGHTDNSGSLKHNMNLSNNRASAVVNALVKMGVSNKRLTAKGIGPLSPNAPNRSEDGKAKNRRVELVEN